jgi:hypothetical protein
VEDGHIFPFAFRASRDGIRKVHTAVVRLRQWRMSHCRRIAANATATRRSDIEGSY